MKVIGTAGHVDHGKSTLVEAITGYHPDRLLEEREREMTIVLGFAWLTLPDGEEVGIVDVPGHRDFIENMLSGVGGIDATIFVIAADEGIMPQTREHLSILDILQIQGGVVALTKVDLIDEPDWLELVEEDVRQVLAGTVLESAPIVRVSSKTREGVGDLIDVLQGILLDRTSRLDLGRPRLPVDRVFTLSGFGTIVTGTLSDGQLKVGDEVVILPRSIKGRIRGLQTHKRKEDVAIPGSRTAINISGVNFDQIQRGNVIAHPGDYLPTRRLDVGFRLLPDLQMQIKHNMEVKLFIGSTEVISRLRLLGCDVLQPGEEGWLQLETRDPVVAIRGDRYILRLPSPGVTLGGGEVIDPRPKGRHKRFTKVVLARLEALADGSPSNVIYQTLLSIGSASRVEIFEQANIEASKAEQAINNLIEHGRILILESKGKGQTAELLISNSYWEKLRSRMRKEVYEYHQKRPLRNGIPREELKSRLRIKTQLFDSILHRLQVENELAEAGPYVRQLEHEIQFDPKQQNAVNELLARFASSPYSPPTIKECVDDIGEELFSALVELNILEQVSREVVFRNEDYQRAKEDIRKLIKKNGSISVSQARDHFKTSRRYVLDLLEYLDSVGVTVRVGDVRIIKGEVDYKDIDIDY